MYEPSAGSAVVFGTPRRQACQESRLVLSSVGIPSEIVHHDATWWLVVAAEDRAAATDELAAYRKENAAEAAEVTPRVPQYGGSVIGVVLYVATVTAIAFQTAQWAFGWDWFLAGQMHAGLTRNGQWWRAVTALTLHLDARHLMSNLVFGAIFGFLAGRNLGGGVAWLAILVAGAIGNGLNALAQPAEHVSIGASTAVFAALGLLVSHAMRYWSLAPKHRWRRWSPLIGGTVLFAMTGVGGERTDVLAHVMGFLAGLLIGAAVSRLPARWLGSSRLQSLAGGLAFALLAVAWACALARGQKVRTPRSQAPAWERTVLPALPVVVCWWAGGACVAAGSKAGALEPGRFVAPLVPRLPPGNALSCRLCRPLFAGGQAEPVLQSVPRREPWNQEGLLYPSFPGSRLGTQCLAGSAGPPSTSPITARRSTPARRREMRGRTARQSAGATDGCPGMPRQSL
ncbi:rhomboid family intramembrane serine protease [Roseiconus nitratireducens]|uniref:Rhomboid family intramembrane serine protease n=2 Tax=Roseiconus nitratireducens TaxID=2605748 RepID=A0A5M6CZX2_9BACT|nr:rhomboid family intramembrane serine protease [Roseiconus nitratireducens]